MCAHHFWGWQVRASAILYAVVCLGNRIGAKAAKKLNKLIRMDSSAVRVLLDLLGAVCEQRALSKMLAIMKQLAGTPSGNNGDTSQNQ